MKYDVQRLALIVRIEKDQYNPKTCNSSPPPQCQAEITPQTTQSRHKLRFFFTNAIVLSTCWINRLRLALPDSPPWLQCVDPLPVVGPICSSLIGRVADHSPPLERVANSRDNSAEAGLQALYNPPPDRLPPPVCGRLLRSSQALSS
jgi:hypothetical protein